MVIVKDRYGAPNRLVDDAVERVEVAGARLTNEGLKVLCEELKRVQRTPCPLRFGRSLGPSQ
jgi:hypothetical protein